MKNYILDSKTSTADVALKRAFLTQLLFGAAFVLPFGVIFFGEICYAYAIPLVCGAALLVFAEGAEKSTTVNVLLSSFIFSQLFVNLFLLFNFVLSFQKKPTCQIFGRVDYCAERHITLERLILFVFIFTLMCFSSVKIHWYAMVADAPMFHLMYVLFAKGVVFTQFAILSATANNTNDWQTVIKLGYWCVSFIATIVEVLFYHRRNDNELSYMCALTAVTLADAIAFKYNFYDAIYSENVLLWITAAVVLSKGFFFKSQTLLLATVNFVLMVVLIYMRESEDLQNNITNHVIPLFCFVQSVKFISIATAKTLKSHKNRFTVTLLVCSASTIAFVSLFIAFTITEKIIATNVVFFNIFAGVACIDVFIMFQQKMKGG
jgi:hypothetical protein